jgi:CRISPR type IV-associated protein Csf3
VETTLYSSYDEVRAHTVGGSRPRSKIPIGGGAFKSQMIDVIYCPARRCTFYFRGNKERIEYLLERHLTGIGADTNAGFGKVRDWGIRELDVDYSLVHPTEGVAMRPIPVKMLNSCGQSRELTFKTPYWYTEWATECSEPGAEVEPAW